MVGGLKYTKLKFTQVGIGNILVIIVQQLEKGLALAAAMTVTAAVTEHCW